MQSHARVVIVGGGMMGVGLLYHLAEEGWTDVLLIEKGELTSGSTWHAAGLCPSFIGDYTMSQIHHVGNSLYPKLEEMTGHREGALVVEVNQFAAFVAVEEEAFSVEQLQGVVLSGVM